MDRVFVRQADREEALHFVQCWRESTPDGDLLDLDIFEHRSTFSLAAFNRSGILGLLPIQQPLMLENFILRPKLSRVETTQVLARLGEHAIEQTERRDRGEAYFLCRDQSTLRFAERHLFQPLPAGLEVRRLNMLETFGN